MQEPSQPSRRAALLGFGVALWSVPGRAEEPRTPAPARSPNEPHRILRAAPLPRKLVPDATTKAETWAFSGEASPPVIRIRHGEELFVRLVNDTPAPLSLHWHGVRGPNAMDGVGGLTQAPVAPGGSFDYRLTPPDSGTFLVRPIVPGGSGEPAGRGLDGLLIVEEREPPAVAADHALLVRDWRLDPSGALAPFGNTLEAALAGRLGNRLSVAGADIPRRIEARAGSRIRLRLANGCNARNMRIRFDNLKLFVAAVDGQPTDRFEPLRATLPFPPGSRYDLLAAIGEAGAKSAVTALIGDGMALVEIEAVTSPFPAGTAGTAGTAGGLPLNRLLPPEIKLQNALRRDLVIAGGAVRLPSGEPSYTGDPRAIWTLGGTSGRIGSQPLFTAKRGQPVVLALHNQTPFPQPMHLHGHVCRLLHNLDDGWEPYWLDTLQVVEGKTARIAFIADNPGKWLIGSSVLERLDTGLWGWFEVA